LNRGCLRYEFACELDELNHVPGQTDRHESFHIGLKTNSLGMASRRRECSRKEIVKRKPYESFAVRYRKIAFCQSRDADKAVEESGDHISVQAELKYDAARCGCVCAFQINCRIVSAQDLARHEEFSAIFFSQGRHFLGGCSWADSSRHQHRMTY
jgi:hypothetical protein